MAGPEIVVSGRGDFSRLYSDLGQVQSRTSRAASVIKAGLVTAAVAGAYGLARLGKASVDAASAAQQSFGATESVFGRYADSVVQLSRRADTALGLSANEYRELSNVIGASLRNTGIEDYAGQTQQLVERGADLAATFGGTTSEAVQALGAALRGEYDPLERYGVTLNETRINSELAKLGLDDLTGSALTQAKQQARLAAIFNDSSRAAGQFARESDTLAGQQQRLSAQTENLQAKLGKLLLPVLTDLARYGNTTVLPFLDKLITGISTGEGDFGELADALGLIGDALSDAGPELRAASADLPSLTDTAKVAATVIGFLADNSDTLAKALPYLAAGVLAYKVAQAAANVAAAAAPALKLADILATRSLAAATRDLAVAQRQAAGVTSTGAGAYTSATRTLSRMQVAARGAAGVAGIGALAVAADTSNDSLKFLGTTASGALLGFSLGGPAGAAIGAGAGALYGLATATEESAVQMVKAKEATANYVDTLDQLTGATTRATRARVADRLLADKETAANLAAANAYGVQTRDVVAGVLGNEAAQERLSAALAKVTKRYEGLDDPYSKQGDRLRETKSALEELISTMGGEQDELGRSIQALRERTSATMTWKKALDGVPKEVVSELRQKNFDLGRKEVNALAQDYKLLPEQKQIILEALGLSQVRGDLGDMQSAFDRLPRSIQTEIGSPGSAKSLGQLTQLNTVYRATPKQIRTAIIASGSDATVKDVQRATRALRGMPENVRIAIQTLKADSTVGDIRRVASEVNATPKQLRVLVAASGVDVSRKQLRDLIADLGKTNRTKADPRVTADVNQALLGIGTVNTKIGQLPTSKTITLTTNIVTNYRTTGNPPGGGGGGAGERVLDPSSRAVDDGRALSDALADGLARGRRDLQAAGKKSLAALLSGLTSTTQLDRALEKLTRGIETKLRDLLKAQGLKGDKLTKVYDRRLKEITKALRDETRELKEQGKLLDRNNEALDQARAKLRDLVQQSRDYATGIKDSVVAYGSVVGLGADQETGKVSLESLLADLKERAYRAKLYADALKLLKRAGLNDFSLQQLIDAGVEGGYATASAILQGGQSAINQVNDLAGQIAETGSGLGDVMSEHFFDAGVEAAQGIVRGLEQQRKKLRKVMEGLADDLLAALRDRLAKGSGKGGNGGGGKDNRLALGLDETHVRRQGARLATALQDGFARPQLDASVSVKAGPTETELLRREVASLRTAVVAALGKVEDAVDENAEATGAAVIGGLDGVSATAWRRGGGSL